MWEYARMWHSAYWSGTTGQARGWERWVMSPENVPAPPRDIGDLEALNFMGRAGWEVIHVENILDMPPGVENARMGHSGFSICSRGQLLISVVGKQPGGSGPQAKSLRSFS